MHHLNTSPTPNTSDVLSAAEHHNWFGLLEERFGIPARTFCGWMLIRPSPKYLCIVPDDYRAPTSPEPGSVGMVFIRTTHKYPKLTSAGAMVFGHAATRNYISVNRERAAAYLARQSFPVTAEEIRHCTGPGYVIVKHDDFVLGMGLLRQKATDWMLESLYPKGWATS